MYVTDLFCKIVVLTRCCLFSHVCLPHSVGCARVNPVIGLFTEGCARVNWCETTHTNG